MTAAGATKADATRAAQAMVCFFIWSLVDERDQKVPRSEHRAGSEADPSFFFLRRSFFAAPHTRARMRANGGNVLASGLRRRDKSRHTPSSRLHLRHRPGGSRRLALGSCIQ